MKPAAHGCLLIPPRLMAALALAAALGLVACNDDPVAVAPAPAPSTPAPCISNCFPDGLDLPNTGPNAVAKWYDIGRQVISGAANPAGATASERATTFDIDMPVLTIAMYDAAALVTNQYQAFVPNIRTELQATIPANTAVAGTLAVTGAACGVLEGLFPLRAALYATECAAALSGIDSTGAAAFQFGKTVASKVIAWRGDDGRETPLPAWSTVASAEPGQFRSLNPNPAINPVNYVRPQVKPFALASAAQFRAPAPYALGSASYATDLEETRRLGAANSTTRTVAQTENAKFHTMPPPLFWMKNLQQFATTQPTLVENARLMAALWVALGDATTACFESKYFYRYWRPVTAIQLADLDGNLATVSDPTWAPVVATPNHPEYPAAHGCDAGATASVLSHVFRTAKLRFTFTTEVATVVDPYKQQAYASTEAMTAQIEEARVAGGMHFRNAVVQGVVMGRLVASQVLAMRFQAVP
ncbi:MAG: vanadium-dependent haloperoxidase [Steroidobacteraceae bacterium]